jgi:hypothetical protein
MEVLAEIAHDLDWGICCDTCQDCAEINSGRILIALFDYWWNQDDDDDDWDKFRARMRELSRANTCPRHKKDDVK